MPNRRGLASFLGVVLLAAAAAGQAGQTDTGRPAPADATPTILVPHETWDCFLPGGIPSPETGTLVFEAAMTLDRVADVGTTQYGRRQVAVVRDGTVSGPRLKGAVTTGALDFQLTLPNGVIEIEQILVLRTDDGSFVYVRAAGTGADAGDVRVVMDFEAPNTSASAWLNSGTYVARRVLDAASRTLTLRVYEVAPPSGAAQGRIIRIEKPAGVLPQPWDYRSAAPSEMRGPQLITETVTLAPSQSVGASKRGNRNIIPITGGEVTGRITAKILPGGADYQNLSKPATIDARYLWETADGEVIIVRNGGTFGSLVPTFEVRTDSPYAWLNTGRFLSSNPGMKPGGVGLTFFESTGP